MKKEEVPILLVIAGPAGSGKSTLCDRLVAEYPEFSRVVTTTTRPPRPGEVNGVHYHFFTPRKFRRKADKGEFLEWAVVHGKNHKNRLYGTLRSSIMDPLYRGENLVINVDVQGVASFRGLAVVNSDIQRSLVTVFIRVDRERLYARMRDRGDKDMTEIGLRLQTAEKEMLEALKFDYIIDSKTRDEDFADLLRIIKEAREKAANVL